MDIRDRMTKEDTMEFKITKEQILAMAEKCPTAKEVLKAGFPEAFKVNEEWEEVGLKHFHLWGNGREVYLAVGKDCPLLVSINSASCIKEKYKIENSKIWRRK
jgi:hypothetical protein